MSNQPITLEEGKFYEYYSEGSSPPQIIYFYVKKLYRMEGKADTNLYVDYVQVTIKDLEEKE